MSRSRTVSREPPRPRPRPRPCPRPRPGTGQGGQRVDQGAVASDGPVDEIDMDDDVLLLQHVHDDADHRDGFGHFEILADDLAVVALAAARAQPEDLGMDASVLAVAGPLLHLPAEGRRVTAHLVVVHDGSVVQIEADARDDPPAAGPPVTQKPEERQREERHEATRSAAIRASRATRCPTTPHWSHPRISLKALRSDWTVASAI